MDVIELDRRVREILTNATRDNVLASAAAMTDLGFGGAIAFRIVLRVVLDHEREQVTDGE